MIIYKVPQFKNVYYSVDLDLKNNKLTICKEDEKIKEIFLSIPELKSVHKGKIIFLYLYVSVAENENVYLAVFTEETTDTLSDSRKKFIESEIAKTNNTFIFYAEIPKEADSWESLDVKVIQVNFYNEYNPENQNFYKIQTNKINSGTQLIENLKYLETNKTGANWLVMDWDSVHEENI